MTTRTINFLPQVFQTPANRKFLNATLDQLVSEPNFKKVNGYIGRTFAPTFKLSDNYLPEAPADRQRYQLEPCVVAKDSAQNVNFFSGYSDLLQQIQYYGGKINNHSRLFKNESYTFNGLIDFDKLVNFGQYYWLPNGPAAVEVYAGAIDDLTTFTVTRDVTSSSYMFSGSGTTQNPDIILARGGTYQFVVNQVGNPFWIQTNPGLTGTQFHQGNIDTRSVMGVVDNGSDNGIVTFTVPQADAQDHFVSMPIVRTVNIATKLKFTDIDHQLVSQVLAKFGGIDKVTNITSGQYLVFLSNDTTDPSWDEKGVYALSPWGTDVYDQGNIIPGSERLSVWQIQLTNVGGDNLIQLVWDQDIPVDHKVAVTSGELYAKKQFYRKDATTIAEVPLITAPLDTLFYNDGTDQHFYGRIRIVDSTNYKLDIAADILGKSQYTSPNGVTFTNGLKVQFGTAVIPASYGGHSYYVEGVGTHIRLISVNELITPELNFGSSSIPFDVYGFDDDMFDEILNGPLTPDYISINRSSLDGNAWSRSNRWFHSEVISATSTYNKTVPKFDQLQRAARPIIEFDANLHLFNNGRVARPNISVLDFSVTDALNQVEGSVVNYNDSTHNYFEAVKFTDGMTVIFANDFDPTVRNKVYDISVLQINGVNKVHLTEAPGGTVQMFDTVVPVAGTTVTLSPVSNPANTYNPAMRRAAASNGLGVLISIDGVIAENTGVILGNSFWFNGTAWVHGQQKSGINVSPKFDVIDDSFNSFGDQAHYNNSSFSGCEIFKYKPGTGKNDTILGFPLSYRSFNNVGDIEFANTFDSDTFSELIGLSTVTLNVNTGYVPTIVNRDTLVKTNIWDTKTEKSKQYQIISGTCDGKTSFFEIDILPEQKSVIPNIKVYLNSKQLHTTQYALLSVGARVAVRILAPIAVNDRVDILIYSANVVSNLGYYEIPSNLEFNALNQNFTSLTLGQFRSHVTTIAANSTEVTGQIPGASNLRDINIKAHGGSILQHSAPAIYSSLFLLEKNVNFIDSITFAQTEYAKFKNRFLEAYASAINNGIIDPPTAVDFILLQLNAVKNNQSPWYYSDMVPYDANKTTTKFTVLSAEESEYEIAAIFNDTVLGNTAILVYLNGIQLIKGIDYTFNQTRPSIVFATTLAYNDTITVVTHHNTDGCYVPETPTKLGLYPKFTPAIFLDNTYQKPINVIRGHDGSITPAFGDIRDQFLLELEKRIYNNIKVTYKNNNFDINDTIPGKFRSTDYVKSEFDQIVSRCFLTWLGNNRVDYSTNQWFESNNPWSWTYNKFRDTIDGSYLPGYWRGIFKYFYDTDAPDTRPWECLGFSEMPSWWVGTYGPAPYTGGNLVLWGDLESGTIRGGDRAGIDARYARPGLSKVIPVTASGTLRNPEEFLVADFNGSDAAGSFAVGDEGPVESAWRKSSDYPFAVQQALALMRPAVYFGQLSNIQDYYKVNGVSQFELAYNKQRITPKDFKINGDTTNLATLGVTRNAGYLNWIADYVTGYGANSVSTISKYLSKLDVQLGYKVAGYTDKAYLKVLAEQSSPSSTNDSVIIPNENYNIHLHKSSPVDRLVYSAVIVEKTNSGYSVSGYNTGNPVFTIVPSEINNNQYSLTVGNSSAVIYGDYKKVKVTVPYGYNFNNKQQVVDFLISYGRYLTSQGFTFDDFDTSLGETKNWTLASKEFLTWTQQGWAPGNILVLSPISNSITTVYSNAVVDQVDNLPAGSKILDVGFNIVRSSMFNVVRDGTSFTMTTLPEITIGLLDINLVQYEHALIFDNQTVFNDIIFKPELGNRQYRLKLIGNVTREWTGQVSPPGFIYSNPVIVNWSSGTDYRKGDIVALKTVMYTALQDVDASDTFNFGLWSQIDTSTFKTGLLPNFAYNAKKFENMYDLDNQVQDQNINTFSNGLIGYRERAYLTDLGMNATTQAKFYQGYIKDKGTLGAITAMANATFNNLSGNISFNEEWAFRVGEYGSTESNQFVEVQLSDNKYTTAPMSMSFLAPGEVSEDDSIVGEYRETLFKRPVTTKTNIFNTRGAGSNYEHDIQTAGFVNLNDIDATVFDIQSYQQLDALITNIYSGYKIWVAKDVNRDWNVYRVDETTATVTNVAYGLDTFATFTMSKPHGLTPGRLFVIRNFSTEVDGFYKVERVDELDTIFAATTTSLENVLIKNPSLDGTGTLFELTSLRMDYLTDVLSASPIYGWKHTDKIWVDYATDANEWGVFSKSMPWVFNSELPGNTATASGNYGHCVAMSPDGGIVVATAPGDLNNNIKLLVKGSTGLFAESAGIAVSPSSHVVGNALAMSQNSIAVAATTVAGDANYVLVYTLEHAVVTSTDIINDSALGFGAAIVISADNQWMYVSAPDANIIQCYSLNPVTTKFVLVDTITGYPTTNFGNSLATNADGSILIVGSSTHNAAIAPTIYTAAGAVYAYTRTGTGFIHNQTIFSPTPNDNAQFGYSVAIINDGDELLVGSPYDLAADYAFGRVYRFTKVSGQYSLNQTIKKPFSQYVEHFGTAIAVDTKVNAIAISSDGAYTVNEAILDMLNDGPAPLLLDGGGTIIQDRIRDSGAVYIYDLLTSSQGTEYCFNQELSDAGIATGDHFGKSIVMGNGTIVVGSPTNDLHALDSGKVMYFTNPTASLGWTKTRHQQSKVDVDNVTKMFLYSSKQQNILANLDYIDPAKGKILGIADQDITYRTSFDPASYNVGTNLSVAVDASFHWGKAQVGQVWWNLSVVRYVDYEQDSLLYRIKNWGRLFPGSVVEVSEWVESDAPPSQYAGDGIPKYITDDAYVQLLMVNSATGVIQSKYYFWVSGKTTVDTTLPFRRNSVSAIAALIKSPELQNIPYATILKNNSLSLINATQFIAASDTILHVDYAVIQNENVIHNEYELVQENSATAILPTKIVNKLVDSLTGADSFGNIVPDYTLTAAERYGISIRPRQTMLVNRLSGVENFVQYANSIFAQNPIVEQFDLTQLYAAEPVPVGWDPMDINLTVNTIIERSYVDPASLTAGQMVLVLQDENFDNQWAIYKVNADKTFKLIRTQSFRTSDHWSKVDWYAAGYDYTVNPTHTVETIKDMATMTMSPGDICRVKNNGAGKFVVYVTNSDMTQTLVGLQEGTIALSDSLWSHDTNQIGFDNDSFDTVKFDLNPTIELRNIFNGIKDNIFINTLDGEFNKLFFVMLNYILSEQRMIDWGFKTSFVSIVHKLRKLDQFPNYIKDNQTYYESYINEVKPYRTKIREYVVNYEGTELAPVHPTDFDLPSYYDADLGTWRSPNGEHARDAVILATNVQYADWLANYTYSIDSVQVDNAGYGYSAPPTLQVIGGGGHGAVLTAVVDFYFGSIVKVMVVNPGTGYTSTPTIRVLGDGVDGSGNQTFTCYPKMLNSKVRSFDTTLKFDRVTYKSNVKQWAAMTTFTAGDVVSYQNKAYSVIATLTTTDLFVPTDYTLVDAATMESAADRVMGYYAPTAGMPPKDPARLFVGIDYPGNNVDGDGFVTDTAVALDTNIQSAFADLALGTRPEDIDIVGGAFIDTYNSHAPEEFIPGMIWDTLDIKVFTINPDDPTNAPMGYRISKAMSTKKEALINDSLLGNWEFHRICADNTTTLARDFTIDDDTIYLVDATTMPHPGPSTAQPGIIYINGEKITYYTIDYATNSISQLRRAVWGTGAPLVHPQGTLVVDASIEQKLPGDTMFSTWLNPGNGTIIDGNGLMQSHTEQATFIRLCPTYLPWLPGQTGIHTDPNLHNTRFDDNGVGEYGTPIHPFDIDPFDSYNVG